MTILKERANMDRQEIFDYIQKKYNIDPDYPWSSSPEDAVLRHKDSRKWFALFMNISKDKLGLSGNERIDIVNVKCNPDTIASLMQTRGFLPAYHMNKEQWMTILLDGTVSDNKILDFIEWSYELTVKKDKK